MPFLFLLVGISVNAQDGIYPSGIPNTVYSSAYKIEVMKDGSDCSIISYVPQEFNRTLTPRDDKSLGEFYFVSGKDCPDLFAATFENMSYKGEAYNPVSETTLDLDAFKEINIVTLTGTIGEGSTKLYLTYLFSDRRTDINKDDIYLGMDYVVDSGDPDLARSPFDISELKSKFESDPGMYDLVSRNSYYKLRSMIVLEKLIVEKLRSEKKLKDITPKRSQTGKPIKLK